MKEIPYELKSSAALAWAFFWRMMATYIPAELFTRWACKAAGFSELDPISSQCWSCLARFSGQHTGSAQEDSLA
jgi:hypothetical protein